MFLILFLLNVFIKYEALNQVLFYILIIINKLNNLFKSNGRIHITLFFVNKPVKPFQRSLNASKIGQFKMFYYKYQH